MTCAKWVLLLLLACAGSLQALDVDFQAAVDRIRVGVSEPLVLTLTITTDESVAHMPAPQVGLNEFVADGPVVSTKHSVSIANGEVHESYVRQLRYSLYPRRRGRITIGPAVLTLDGQVYRTNAIDIEAVAANRGRVAAGNDPASADLENVFVQVDADRRRAFVGQQVTLDYDLYYKVRIYEVGFKEIPSFSGFWSKEVFVAHQLKASQTTVQGIRYNVASLRRMALFPASAGKIRVDPLIISFEVPTGRRGRRLLDVFGSSMQSMVAATSEIEIEVLPLPESGRPVDFAGAVGRFTVTAEAKPLRVSVGDPITLRVAVAGEGSMVQVQAPDLSAISGFKIYDPTVEVEEQIRNGIVGGSRTFEYILIPDQAADLEIPSVRFSYFDPHAETYQIAHSQTIKIRVGGQGEEAGETEYGLSRKDIERVGRDIRHIKPDATELSDHVQLHARVWFWLLQGLMPFTFIALMVYQRHQRRLGGDVAYARSRRARGDAEKCLKRARELLQAGEAVEFHAQIHRALTFFIADRLNIPATSLTNNEQSAVELAAHGIDKKTIRNLSEVLEKCDFGRFASTPSTASSMAKLQGQAEAILARLEGLK